MNKLNENILRLFENGLKITQFKMVHSSSLPMKLSKHRMLYRRLIASLPSTQHQIYSEVQGRFFLKQCVAALWCAAKSFQGHRETKAIDLKEGEGAIDPPPHHHNQKKIILYNITIICVKNSHNEPDFYNKNIC